MGYFIAFRTDWAAKVGATLSDYESTKYSIDEYGRVYYWPNPDGSATLEWFEELLIGFRDGDPDGNGKNDTVPFGGGGGPRYSWLHSPIAGAFQAQLEGRRNTLVDGRLYTEEISPNYRKYLQLMAKWYETGLLDKEFLTIDRAKAWDKVQAGITASQSIHYWYSGREDRMHLPPNSFVPEEDLGKVEVPLVQPVGPDGYRGGGAYNASPWYNMNQYVSADVDDEKLKVILQIVDAAYYGTAEDWVHQRFGKEGVHFDWSGEAWNSTPVRRAEEDITPTAGEPTVGPFVNSYPPSASADRIVFNNAPMITTFLTEHIVSPAGMARTLLSVPLRLQERDQPGRPVFRARRGAQHADDRVLGQGDRGRSGHQRRRRMGQLRRRLSQVRWRRDPRRVVEDAGLREVQKRRDRIRRRSERKVVVEIGCQR